MYIFSYIPSFIFQLAKYNLSSTVYLTRHNEMWYLKLSTYVYIFMQNSHVDPWCSERKTTERNQQTSHKRLIIYGRRTTDPEAPTKETLTPDDGLIHPVSYPEYHGTIKKRQIQEKLLHHQSGTRDTSVARFVLVSPLNNRTTRLRHFRSRVRRGIQETVARDQL